jgi:hypothetical protein
MQSHGEKEGREDLLFFVDSFAFGNRSPINANLSSTIAGLTTLRAFGVGKKFDEIHRGLVDTNLKVFFMNYSTQRWLAFRLEIISITVITFTAFLVGKDKQSFVAVKRNSLFLSFFQ